MSGLLRRLTRRRPATADETGSATPESSEPAGAPAETPAETGGGHPVPAADDQATQVLPPTGEQPTVVAPAETAAGGESGASGAGAAGSGATDQTVVAPDQTVAIQQPEPRRDLPAGVDPSELADAPVPSARRGKLRRRLRYLRAVRDLLLRDLGGFTYEVERTAGGTAQEAYRRLIETKTNRIAALDTEVRGLEARLAEPHGDALLREPGIGGTCPECGELHASDAHYCSRCGAPLDPRARARRDAAVAAAAVQHTTASHPTAEPAPASVLWAAGPRPERSTPEAEPEEEESRPSEATSQWLALPKHRDAEPETAKADEEATGGKPPVTGWVGARGEGGESVAAGGESATGGESAAGGETATGGESVAAGGEIAAGDESVEAGGESAAARGESVAASGETATGGETVAPSGETAPGGETAAGGESVAPSGETVAPSGETAAGGDTVAAGGETASDPAEAAPSMPAAEVDEAPAEVAPAKPKRPRASRAKKPAAEKAEAADAPAPETVAGRAAATGEAAGAEAPRPKRSRAKKPPAPEFEPNGKRDEDVPEPVADPLTTRREQGS